MRFYKGILLYVLVLLVTFTGCGRDNHQEESTSVDRESGLALIKSKAEIKDVDDITFSEKTYLNHTCKKMYKLLTAAQLGKKVTYKKKDIIEGIKAVNVGNSLLPRSLAVTIDDLEKYLAIDNVKKIETQSDVKFIIEYPMEESTFAVVVTYDGRILGTYMQAKEMRDKKEMVLLVQGMSIETVRKIYPEIVISAKGNKIISGKNSSEQLPDCVLALKDGQEVTVCFEKKDDSYIVSEIAFTDNLLLSEEEWKALKGQEESVNHKQAEMALLEGKVIWGENLWNEFVLQSKMKEPCNITVRYYYGDSPNAYEFCINYDGEFYNIYSMELGEKKKYKYLVELSGQLPNAQYKQHGFYLVNDKNVTYDELQWSILSSQSTDYVDFKEIYSEWE